MTFEDRLRDQLRRQADHVDVELGAGRDPRAHARSRQTRRRLGTLAVIAVIVGGSAAWISSRGGDAPEVATEAPASTDDAATGAADSAPAESSDTPDDAPAPLEVAPLEFTPVDAAGAPGGINLWTKGVTGDLYYVLSTAPGLTDEQAWNDGGFGRNDTLYTWRGDNWSETALSDRFITGLGGADGLLYAVSTGSDTGDGPAAGTSTDGGETWDWVPLPLGDEFSGPYGGGLTTAVGPAGQLVVAWNTPGADWEQGLALARDAGLDLSWETHDIVSIDGAGIRYVPHTAEVSCRDQFWAGLEELVPYPEAIGEAIFEDGGEPTEEEMAAYQAAMAEWDAARGQATTALLAEMAADPACEAFATCQAAQIAWEDEQQERVRQVAIEAGALRPDQTLAELDWSLLDESAQIAIDEAYGTGERGPTFPGGLECETTLYGPGWDAADIVTVTWDSLGVVPPAAWSGAIAAYLVDESGAHRLDAPFEPGYVQSVSAQDDQFVVDIVDPGSFEFEFAGDEGSEPAATRWTGSGAAWTATELPSGWFGGEVTGPGGAMFARSWDETSRSGGLTRMTAGGSTFISDSDLFGSEFREIGVWDLAAGAEGVAAASVDYERQRSVVAWSPDGVSWASTVLDDLFVDGVLVGPDGVLLFAHPFDGVGTTVTLVADSGG